jgi:lactate dehydrogenase-like 2-hydroxyacid dehydrogenase
MGADTMAKISGSLIMSMPNLKLIHVQGVGYDGVDLEAATSRGVMVCNNKGANADSTAETAILLILGLLRSIVPGYRETLSGNQILMKHAAMSKGITELGECKVGLIGFGCTGKALALRLKAFGCEVFYHTLTRKPSETEKEYSANWLPQDELLASCDIVSLHVPANETTAGMADSAFFEKMKPGSLFINTARGELVDNDALIKALRSGKLAGAGIDTLSPEPVQADHPLVNLPAPYCDRVFFSPHIGGVTSTMFKKAHRLIWENIEKTARGERPDNVCNGL